MKVKAIKVTAQIQLCCGIVSTVLGIVAVKLQCLGYETGTPIWGGLAVSINRPLHPGPFPRGGSEDVRLKHLDMGWTGYKYKHPCPLPEGGGRG